MSAIPEITSETFEREVLKSDLPVLVDLYAPWCGPCRMMSVVLEKLAPQLAGKAKLVKINTDQQPELASAFGVSSIPMLALLHHGKLADSVVGLVPAKTIEQMIDNVLAAKNAVSQ